MSKSKSDPANHLVIKQHANLNRYPHPDAHFHPAKNQQITIGDLHGNALKLLYTLVRLNVIDMTAYDYQSFAAIYSTPVKQITKNQLLRFEKILSRISLKNRMVVRLLGDELCDRGSNDYFTLKIIEKLHQQKLPMEILFSNHGMDFLGAFERTDDLWEAPCLSGDFTQSLRNLKVLIQRKLVSETKVREIVQHCYKPYLNALSYSLVRDDITIYSHAPAGLETIAALANKLNIPYQDNTAQDLAKTIDKINDVIQHDYIQKNSVHRLFSLQSLFDGYCGKLIDFITQPIAALIWNRDYAHVNRPAQHHNYKIFFAHGHDLGELTHDNIFNLDNVFGKGLKNPVGEFQFLSTRAAPTPRTKDLFDRPGWLMRLLSKTKKWMGEFVDKLKKIFRKDENVINPTRETTKILHEKLHSVHPTEHNKEASAISPLKIPHRKPLDDTLTHCHSKECIDEESPALTQVDASSYGFK